MRLLKLEYNKIVGNKSFWIFTLLFLVLLPFLVFFVPSFAGGEVEGIEFYPLIPRSSEVTWYLISLISSWFTFFLLNFVLIYHITNEYTYRTVRQNVIDGLTRGEYLKGKIMLMLVISILATAYVLLIGIIGNFYFSTFDAPEPNIVQKVLGVKIVGVEDYGAMFAGVENIYRYFIQTVATFSFAMLIGFLVRRGILAILIFYSAFIIEFIVGLILKSYDFEKLYEYLPLQSIGESLPIIDFTQLIRGITSPVSISMLNIGVVIFYIILFLFLIKKLFFKRDIS